MSDDSEAPDSLDPDFDEESADLVGVVVCPYCGETNEIALDPDGGAFQDYVEDCQVCCRPWHLRVTYSPGGVADITADAMD